MAPEALGSLSHALRYAIERTPDIKHSGTVSMVAVTHWPTLNDGPSAGAPLAVALIAMFNGASVYPHVCLTGTLESGGHIGKVGSIPQKMRAAKSSGCRIMLVPKFQIVDNNWDLSHEALQLGLQLKEVETIDEAYELMVGRRL